MNHQLNTPATDLQWPKLWCFPWNNVKPSGFKGTKQPSTQRFGWLCNCLWRELM